MYDIYFLNLEYRFTFIIFLNKLFNDISHINY